MKLIEVIGALIIMIIVMPTLLGIWEKGYVELQKRQAADHLMRVSKASASYVRKHQATLLTSATANSGPSVSIATLVTESLLPAGFSNTNVWGQGYTVYIRQPQAKELQAIVLTTGGRASTQSIFASAIVPSAALMAGGAAGFVPTGALPGQTAGTLHGAGGGWVVNLGTFGIPSPGAGHLGALASFDSAALGQDFLYRVAVPGHEELNAMQTELDMTDHAIRDVKEIQFVEREITGEACTAPEDQGRLFLDRVQGLYLCRNNALEIVADTGNATLFKTARLAQNGEKIAKPVCPSGTGTVAQIFTTPVIAEAGPDAPPISSFQAWATSLSDTEWQVHLRLLTSSKALSADGSGWVYPEANYGRIMILTTCTKAVTP